MKNRLTCAVAALAFCYAASAGRAFAQAPQQAQKEAPAAVSGRVRVGERAGAGLMVMLTRAEPGPPDRRVVARARANAEGFYRMTGVPPGRYLLMPAAPAHVVREATPYGAGLFVMLSAGESFEDADFTLAPGGVITGRVTDAEGKPVVGEGVRVEGVGGGRGPGNGMNFDSRMHQTDDRGVYRLYGLPAGRYSVSAGRDAGGTFFFGRGSRGYYQRTYHPDTTDAKRAKIVEVEEGGEATDIDITLGRLSKTFKVSGRIVYAATGRPAAGVAVGAGPVEPRGNRMHGGGTMLETNARGEFQIEGFLPGWYGVFAGGERMTDTYSDVTSFEITDADVGGLEVRIHKGSSLSGVVAIEGVSDRAVAARLMQRLALTAHVDRQEGLMPPRYERVAVNADGSFHVTGLRPGRAFLHMAYPQVKGLMLRRTELNGAEQHGGVEVPADSHVTGVRVVFVYGTASVRGQIIARENDQPTPLPEGTHFNLSLRMVGATGSPYVFAGQIDSRGRFLVENIPSGEVELMVHATGRRSGQAKQIVSLAEGGDANVTVMVDLKEATGRPAPVNR